MQCQNSLMFYANEVPVPRDLKIRHSMKTQNISDGYHKQTLDHTSFFKNIEEKMPHLVKLPSDKTSEEKKKTQVTNKSNLN